MRIPVVATRSRHAKGRAKGSDQLVKVAADDGAIVLGPAAGAQGEHLEL
jgi:hypothetical protein